MKSPTVRRKLWQNNGLRLPSTIDAEFFAALASAMATMARSVTELRGEVVDVTTTKCLLISHISSCHLHTRFVAADAAAAISAARNLFRPVLPCPISCSRSN